MRIIPKFNIALHWNTFESHIESLKNLVISGFYSIITKKEIPHDIAKFYLKWVREFIQQ